MLLILEFFGGFTHFEAQTHFPLKSKHGDMLHGQNVYRCEQTPSSPYPCLGHQPPRTLKFWWKSSIEVAMDQWKTGRTVRVGVGSVRWSSHQVTHWYWRKKHPTWLDSWGVVRKYRKWIRFLRLSCCILLGIAQSCHFLAPCMMFQPCLNRFTNSKTTAQTTPVTEAF